MRLDFALMHVAAFVDPFQMQQVLPYGQCSLAVQGVVGNAFAHEFLPWCRIPREKMH